MKTMDVDTVHMDLLSFTYTKEKSEKIVGVRLLHKWLFKYVLGYVYRNGFVVS